MASACGFTKSNYVQLTELQNRFGSDKFVVRAVTQTTNVTQTDLHSRERSFFAASLSLSQVLAFPCNQFGNQEPGTPEEIKAFTKHYNVSFPVFSKVTREKSACVCVVGGAS